MSMAHTPGPWHHDRGNILTADGRCLATVFSGPCASLEEADANGRLIAAAPELLEALRTLLDAVEGAHVTVGDCAQTRAALAAAVAPG